MKIFHVSYIINISIISIYKRKLAEQLLKLRDNGVFNNIWKSLSKF